MSTFLTYLPIIISAIALIISVVTIYMQLRNRFFTGTRDFNLSWQAFNQVVADDQDFQDFEMVLHPYGELCRVQIKRVYFYFMRFNTAYSAYRNTGEFHSPLAISALHTEANVSFKDREFVRKHVFSRGYDREFCDKFEELWEEIETTGKFLPMHNDVERKYSAPLASNQRPLDWTETS